MTAYPERQRLIMWINEAVTSGARKTRACKVIGLNIRTLQRWTDGVNIHRDNRPSAKRPEPANKLSKEERDCIINICLSPEFADVPPSRIVPTLADRGQYIASESSFYRMLKAHNMAGHRGRSKGPGTYKLPTTFTATKPNELWSWDITHLPSEVVGRRYYLYMFEDLFSRKIVGAEVHERETGQDAAALLQRAIWTEKCGNSNLVLHSDNGAPMKSFTMQAKMYELGVVGSRSRPRVSNDNPYSESLFRTVKYCPQWPKGGFKNLMKAREWVEEFVSWYNNQHRHSRIKYVTPNEKHRLQDIEILKNRTNLYEAQKSKHPSRWSGQTRNWQPVEHVTLNPERDLKAA